MNRRVFVQGLAAALGATSRAVDAQPLREKRVGIVGLSSMPAVNETMFKQGIEQSGPVDRNRIVFVDEHTDGTPDRLPDAVTKLLRVRPDVIYARGPASVNAAVQATKTIPIVAIDLELWNERASRRPLLKGGCRVCRYLRSSSRPAGF